MSRDEMLALAERCKDHVGTLAHVRMNVSLARWGTISRDILAASEALRLSASLLDGSGQTKSADGGQCNEQSAQGLIRADVCDAGVQQTWDERPECGASSDDLCGKVFSPVDAETDASNRSESTPPAIFVDPQNFPPESGEL